MPGHSRLGAGAVGASAWRFWPMFLLLEHSPAPLLPLFVFTALEEIVHANNQASHGSCTLHTASQVPGAIEPHALPMLALKTPSIQQLLCNSQCKHIPDFILILSPSANHLFLFLSPPNPITHSLIFSLQSHYISVSSIPLSWATGRWKNQVGWVFFHTS